jgi:hypothetical protein
MSLSARIVLDPSWRIAVVEAAFGGVGAIVAAVALAVRRPEWTPLIIALGSSVAGGLTWASARRFRRAGRMLLVTSDRLQVGVEGAGFAADGDARVAPSTLLWPAIWPGFAVVALTGEFGGPVVRRPVVLAELPFVGRRHLARYLTWALRGGNERAANAG